jgi:hypothetical protein
MRLANELISAGFIFESRFPIYPAGQFTQGQTRTICDFDIIAVGPFTLYVPASLYMTLDVLTRGDLVEVTFDREHRVIALSKGN